MSFLAVNRIWQFFESVHIFSADATEETKICHDKIYTLIFSWKFLFGLPLRIGP